MSIYDKLLLIILFIGVGAVSAHRFNSLTNDTDREGKLLSLFQIVRRERGNCRICYSADLPTDFMTSGKELKAIGKPSECCAYGATGAGSQFDCLIIPGALNPTMLSKQGMFDEFCGRSAGIQNTGESVGADLNKTVCSARQPFSVRFLSDSFEVEEEIGFGPMVGFKLSYLQTSGGC
ncbi:hypothetical protein TCAL_15495 [Tigriopus californicus]|uniref:CUB domain-containing protein n=1 Tax=Tigriopus californicus TaxID=6832 RepID=A0A553PRX3_TIGCA|nr:hypothetical protein TCAL_15495 [Tigriopus californicus]